MNTATSHPSFTLLPISDASEEIFLLYSKKLGQSHSILSTKGLGFVSTDQSTLNVEITVVDPGLAANGYAKASSVKTKIKSGKKGKSTSEVTVEIELGQDLNGLRNRKGDTGSVLWRVSIHLAHFLLSQHHFPSPSHRPLFPTWSTLSILEFGSGSGFLGLALHKTVKRWVWSDQFSALDLVVKNLQRNGVMVDEKDGLVREVDWLVESEKWEKKTERKEEDQPDLIICADCIYNPSISTPLARTIDRFSIVGTKVLVVSELRDEEPLEVFLTEWIAIPGWEVVRVELGEEDREGSGLGDKSFVVWLGEKV